MGRAVLCSLPQRERDYLLDHIRLADEENWPRIKLGIEQAQRDYAERGFCLAVGDWHQDIHSVGVPLLGIEREKSMAFNCGGPAFLLPRDKLENDLGPRLVQLVRKVEADMGRV
jgi:DNA-binding IclR family transcriptional regulator